MTGALLAFCAMAVSIRELAGALSVMEILAVRSGFGLVVMAALAALFAAMRVASTFRLPSFGDALRPSRSDAAVALRSPAGNPPTNTRATDSSGPSTIGLTVTVLNACTVPSASR